MIISDLNYVEVVAEASAVQGGGDVTQTIRTTQNAGAGVGGAGRNSILNTALALNVAIPTAIGVGVL
jgi:hypothetical protein